MASVPEITTMCRSSQVHQAYELAAADMEQQLPWAQREMGWVLYYLIKNDTDSGDFQSLVSHLEELESLDRLEFPYDNLIIENVLFKVAEFVKNNLSSTGIDTPSKLSTLFSKLRGYCLEPSKGYSFLLQCFIKCDVWQEMADFLDWWNLDKLTQDDYIPFRMDNGRTIISVAERAYIANSKALLRLNDLGRIEEFLPKLDMLMQQHPEMTYPGYFYGKLLLSLGRTSQDALRVIVPFAKRKSTEFWVWQLLSDVFVNDQDKQLACLIRAVHCRTQENFLGQVRIKMAALYIQRNQLDLAKFQIDRVTQCYLSQGWHLPDKVDCWIHQPWINTVNSSDNAPIDYMAITNEILGEKTEEAIAVVTHVDPNSQKAAMVYGFEKRMSHRLRFKVETGVTLKLNFVIESNGKQRILNAGKCQFPSDLNYAKIVEGTIKRRRDWPYAFLYYGSEQAFVAPLVASKYNVKDGETAKCRIVYDFNKKENSWNWIVISVNR